MRYPHWQFFESLDDDLHSLSRIIEFDRNNFSTHSVLLARLYLSVCSEIDVVAKLLCARIDPAKSPANMDEYRSLIAGRYRNFSVLKIEMPAHELDFQPWSTWSSGTNPPWWGNYNKVKHQRNTYYREANLGNVLESASGLLVMLTYYYQPELYALKAPFQPLFKSMRIEAQYARTNRLPTYYSLPDFGKGATG
ncbi:MAG: hypothetical protein HY298_16015 [Verrucomicrobia bacterium]|nr:hypothetical protein [Verrucomicrobiota bacterium]